jgi:hypothetical protein
VNLPNTVHNTDLHYLLPDPHHLLLGCHSVLDAEHSLLYLMGPRELILTGHKCPPGRE